MKSLEELQKWIISNLLYSRGLVCKKCKLEWFIKYNNVIYYDSILHNTSFLDDLSPTLPQRIWHIINNITQKHKCNNIGCKISPTFFSFNKGYLQNCSQTCAQKNPITIEKIKNTNKSKYGVEYGLSNEEIKFKSRNTWIKNYGVDNPTKSKKILKKISDGNMKKYGVDWILRDQSKKETAVFKKYGVYNVLQIDDVKKSVSQTRKYDFYDSILESDRFKSITPLFSKEEYQGCCIDHKFLCNTCKTEFVGKIEDGEIPRCLNCFPKINSKPQKDIISYITSILGTDIKIIENERLLLSLNKELDIYIPDLKVAIEFDGLYWHSENSGGKDKNYHLNKTLECEKLGIKLIHIFEDEWINNNELIKSKLKHILGINNDKPIYARKCLTEFITTSSIKSEFLKKTHIQGNDQSSISVGLYTNENFPKLVSIMTFGKLRRALGNKNLIDGEYELIRYSSSKRVVGGASKLLSCFIKTYKPTKIISFADRRWSQGNLYEKLGFEKVSEGSPNYWYFKLNSNYKRYHRFGFAKHTLSKKLPLYNSVLTEWENMKNNGWDRIWDCGSLKYHLTFPSKSVNIQ